MRYNRVYFYKVFNMLKSNGINNKYQAEFCQLKFEFQKNNLLLYSKMIWTNILFIFNILLSQKIFEVKSTANVLESQKELASKRIEAKSQIEIMETLKKELSRTKIARLQQVLMCWKTMNIQNSHRIIKTLKRRDWKKILRK